MPLGQAVNIIQSMPAFWSLLIGYLVVDFLGWLHHLLHHKVLVLWAFHAVHHSQQHLNVFSNKRVHSVDWFVTNIIKFYPLLFFTYPLGIILNYIALHKILEHLNYSNVKTSCGVSKYILVSPQSYRIHHSGGKVFDQNFSISLSIWDYFFGTQRKNYDIYSSTGISAQSFPNEEGLKPAKLANTFFKQQWYPFKKVYAVLRK